MSEITTIGDLTPDPRNARAHTPRNVGMIETALNEVGAARSIVIDEDGVVLAGNATIEAAAQAGIERVQVVEADGNTIIAVRRSGLTPEQKTKLALYDNRAAELADWDAGVLASLAQETDLSKLFYDDELAAILAALPEPDIGGAGDDFDATPQDGPTRTNVGELWSIGPHRLLVGDCTDPANVERLMGGARFDLLVTSPPYNSGDGGYKTDYSGKTKKFYTEKTDDRTEDEWVAFCNLVLYTASVVARDELSTVVWNVMYTARCRSGYGRVMFAGGHPFTVKETICWDKGAGFPTASKGILSRNWELVFVLSQGEKYHTTQGLNEPRWAKWDIPRPTEQLEEHHATFPLELAERAMREFSLGGSNVYDPFLGSGTTLIAAHQTGRRCYGMEISPRYADVILRRAEAAHLPCARREGE